MHQIVVYSCFLNKTLFTDFVVVCLFLPQIQSLFREEYGEVYTISVPTRQERTDFFQDLILNQAAEAPPSNKKACM